MSHQPRLLKPILTVAAWATCLPAGVAGWLALIAARERSWFFPGDPPFPDLALFPAAVALALSTILMWACKRLPEDPERATFLPVAIRGLIVVSLSAFLFCAACILFRFSPAWKGVRDGIQRYSDAVAASAGGAKGRALREVEFTSLKQRVLPEAVEVELRGFGIVRLRMANGVYPYVIVDFGDGGNALFDPRTMWCIYAD